VTYAVYFLDDARLGRGADDNMSLSGAIIVLLYLPVIGAIQILLIGLFGIRRIPAVESSFQECPICGAQNRKTKRHCYCCGQSLIPVRAEKGEAALIVRVKQADANKLGRRATADDRSVGEEMTSER
jgi:hypothetical protein